MKKCIIAAGVCGSLLVSTLSADALKKSLSGMLNQKEEMPSMVNLSGISLGGKPKPVVPKTRPSTAVIATVNGHKVLKKEADRYLQERTGGKVKDFDLLPKEQKRALVRELALPYLIAADAESALSQEEKEALLSQAWVQKSAAKMAISDAQVEAAYEKLKAQAKAQSALRQIPPLDRVKKRIRMQIAEQKLVRDLLRGAEVRLAPDSESIAGYVGMMALTVDDVDRALQVMTRGRTKWSAVPEKERLRVLQMVAPGKLVAMAAKNGLTQKERETALANYWMQKQIAKIDVSDKEIEKRYRTIKKMAKQKKSTKKLPDLATLGPSLKMQIAQEKFVETLMKNAKIKLK